MTRRATHDVHRPATGQDFFDDVYRRSEDPWDFATSDYEQQRYRAIVRMLDDPRILRDPGDPGVPGDPRDPGDRPIYRSAFEPGCSIGVVTAMLAPRCRTLVATDLSPIAVERARARCAGFTHVDVRTGRLPDDVPAGPLDLVVLSEIGYYFTVDELVDVVARLRDAMTDGALLVAAHWTGSSADHVLSGHQVHAVLDGDPSLDRTASSTPSGYLLAGYLLASYRNRR